MVDEVLEAGEAGILGFEPGWRDGEELGPVGAGAEGLQLLFDEGQGLADLGPLGLPGEVNGWSSAMVRSSVTKRWGVIRSRSFSTARMAW